MREDHPARIIFHRQDAKEDKERKVFGGLKTWRLGDLAVQILLLPADFFKPCAL
jgi:hypothetical protein